MRYMILDEETQTHAKHKRKANPFLKKNYIVMRGWKVQGDKRCSSQYFTSREEVTPLDIPDDVNVMVGHNLKFDLLHEMNYSAEQLRAFFLRGGRIWDTQYACYLLRAQVEKYRMVRLTDLAPEYGGTTKIDGIKELWDAGVQTSDIDRELLTDYLIGTEDEERNAGDIGNTEKIYLGQLREAKSLGMTNAIMRRMDGLAATTDMEWNGIKVDVEVARKNLKTLIVEEKVLKKKMSEYTAFIPEEVGFSFSSKVHVSCLIFGGTIKYQKSATYKDESTGELARLKATEARPLFQGRAISAKHPRVTFDEEAELHWVESNTGAKVWQDQFKSGKKIGQGRTRRVPIQGELKTKIQDFFFTCPGYMEAGEDQSPTKNVDGKGGPVYSTSADAIEELSAYDIPFLKDMGRLQAIGKEIGTYYIRTDKKGKQSGMLLCVQPEDHIVHHSLNHAITVTTRLSSSDPNGQNFPTKRKSRVKEMFISRFGKDGRMLEADYSQLEVVINGLLSMDTNLIHDLNMDIDFHCKRVAAKCNVTYEFAVEHCKNEDAPDHEKWKNERGSCKVFSFRRAYGGGAASVAAAADMTIEQAKDLIAAEDKMYPGVNEYHALVTKEIEATAEPFRDGTREWRAFRRGTYQSVTGTMYSFRSYDAPAWMKKKGVIDTFMQPEIKNYPTQGTGGEIVQLVAGILWRVFLKNNNFGGKAFLVNTVHDCFWVDCHVDVLDEVAAVVKKVMEGVPGYLKKFYGIDCPVRFPVELEVGLNMYDMKHHHA